MKIKYLFWCCAVILQVGCDSNSLDSLEGPSSGKVSGLLCDDLEILTAAQDSTVLQMMIGSGKCVKIPSTKAKQVQVIRTVMMPGNGKYSQVEVNNESGTKKMWIKTASIAATN